MATGVKSKASDGAQQKMFAKAKAHTVYRTSDGIVVPGVTTVLGLMNKPALVAWANNLGLKGINTKDYVNEAAEIGKLTHARIAQELGGDEVNLDQYSRNQIGISDNAMCSFYEWRKGHTLETILIETAMVSDKLRYGGQIDWYGLYDGQPWLLDFKTSSGVYEEHKIQTAAYRKLLEENGHAVAGSRLIQIGRAENEDYQDHPVSGLGLDLRFEIFKRLLDVYWLQRDLKDRVKD